MRNVIVFFSFNWSGGSEKIISYWRIFNYIKQGLTQLPMPALLVVRLSTTNIYSITRQFLSSGKPSPIRSFRHVIFCISTDIYLFPTYATNIPKYLVWLLTWSAMSSAVATQRMSMYQSLLPRPGHFGAVCSHRGTLAQSESVTVRQWKKT